LTLLTSHFEIFFTVLRRLGAEKGGGFRVLTRLLLILLRFILSDYLTTADDLKQQIRAGSGFEGFGTANAYYIG